MNGICHCGKKMFDKKGAITLRNLSLRIHHIKMREYHCAMSDTWHLTTVKNNKKNHFDYRRKHDKWK